MSKQIDASDVGLMKDEHYDYMAIGNPPALVASLRHEMDIKSELISTEGMPFRNMAPKYGLGWSNLNVSNLHFGLKLFKSGALLI